jgi:UDP-N-acetylmuramate--alanine ligase
MSAIASVLVGMGHVVSGSDLKASPVADRLAEEGVEVSIGHRAANVERAELVTFSPAVPADNVELAEARGRGVPVRDRASLLAGIAALRRCIAVSGTHGKTTTCSMLSLALVEAGLRPSFLVGADVNEIGTNAVWDEGEWLVLEADESYGTFRTLVAEIAAVTSVEADHLDHYGDLATLQGAFEEFLRHGRRALVGADDPGAAGLGRQVGAQSVGLAPGADYHVSELVLRRSSVAFSLDGPSGPLGRLEVAVPGRHNAENAAMAAVLALGAGARFDQVASALARFAGVPRRFEFRGEANGVTFVDDYAHLPGEVSATLAAARAGGWQRVVAVFQPHRYTRTATLAGDFGGAFDDADVVVVTDVYSAGDPPLPGVSGLLVADAVAGSAPGRPVHYAATRRELRRVVAGVLEPGDVCCTLGAGDLTTLPDELIEEPTW